MALEAETGWVVCGINGCILADRHAGECIFPMEEGKRRRAPTKNTAPDYNAPQLLSKVSSVGAKEKEATKRSKPPAKKKAAPAK